MRAPLVQGRQYYLVCCLFVFSYELLLVDCPMCGQFCESEQVAAGLPTVLVCSRLAGQLDRDARAAPSAWLATLCSSRCLDAFALLHQNVAELGCDGCGRVNTDQPPFVSESLDARLTVLRTCCSLKCQLAADGSALARSPPPPPPPLAARMRALSPPDGTATATAGHTLPSMLLRQVASAHAHELPAAAAGGRQGAAVIRTGRRKTMHQNVSPPSTSQLTAVCLGRARLAYTYVHVAIIDQ